MLLKKINKLLISIIKLIESFFQKIESLVLLKKKKKINLQSLDNKITIIFAVILISIISYFLIPTFYDKDLVKNILKNQIQEKFNLEVKLDENINYGIFPKPHFNIKNTSIIFNGKDVAKSKDFKIFISIKSFHSIENLIVKNLLFKKTEFNINYKDIKLFDKILNYNKTQNHIKFKNSILFFKNKNDDVIFFTDIDNLNFFYNKDLIHQLNANFDIFNIPFNLVLENNNNIKKMFTNLNSHRIRLGIQNDFDYKDKKIDGILNFEIINDSKLFNYTVNQKNLNFNSEDNNFKGSLDFKPFYLFSELNFIELNFKKIFDEDSILINLINSEILNNQNLNAQVNFKFDKIKGINYFKDISLKTYFEEGNIIIKNSSINWNDSILINLDDTQLLNENDEIIFSGTITLDFKDQNIFYSYYQIKRNFRQNIKKVKLDVLLNLNDRKIQIENFKINNNSSRKIDDYVNYFNSKNIDIFNKVIFRNSVKEFFAKNYKG